MWKLQDFSVIQILREIDANHFEAPKTANLTLWVALNFEFMGIFDTLKCEIIRKTKIQTL